MSCRNHCRCLKKFLLSLGHFHEHGRWCGRLHRFLQGQLSGKKEQVEGMLERQRNLAQQLEQITQQKRDLQQRYEEARSKANRAEAMTAHDEGEVSQLHAKLQDEITNKERLKSSLRAMQKKYEKEKKLRQVQLWCLLASCI